MQSRKASQRVGLAALSLTLLLLLPPRLQPGPLDPAAPAYRRAQGRHNGGPAWHVTSAWDEREEREFSQFVGQLGSAVAARTCGRLDECLRTPAANRLYDPGHDPYDLELSLAADCADLPYALRAYFAYKHHLPFAFVSRVEGAGTGDVRLLSQVVPTRSRSWQTFPDPLTLMAAIKSSVHSGMYRTAPPVEETDFYPVQVRRETIRPGTVFYNPAGHVLMVAAVRPDGNVYFIDAQPDGSLSWSRFDETFGPGVMALGGGWKHFRPLHLERGRVVREANRSLADYDGAAQWKASSWSAAGVQATYTAWVRSRLAERQAVTSAAQELHEQIDALCRAVEDRVLAVDRAVEDGIPNLPHPARLPDNVYVADGTWETYATPSRDARLRELVAAVRRTASGRTPEETDELRRVWAADTARPACHFSYRNSHNHTVSLTLDQVLDRLLELSFDPYHCPERRWGAAPSSPEMASCTDDATASRWYRAEADLRSVLPGDGAPRLERAAFDPRPTLGRSATAAR